MATHSVIERRLDRLRRKSYFCLIAMDHGLSQGSIPGIQKFSDLDLWCTQIHECGIPAAVINIGALYHLSPMPQTAVVAQLVGMPLQVTNGQFRRPLSTPLAAISNGADAISLQVTTDGPDLSSNIADLTRLTYEAHVLGLPVLLMVNTARWDTARDFINAVRSFSELGVDLIKISPGEHLEDLVGADLEHLCVPLLYPGGERSESFLHQLSLASKAGYAGVCIGRNLFQSPWSLSESMLALDDAFAPADESI